VKAPVRHQAEGIRGHPSRGTVRHLVSEVGMGEPIAGVHEAGDGLAALPLRDHFGDRASRDLGRRAVVETRVGLVAFRDAGVAEDVFGLLAGRQAGRQRGQEREARDRFRAQLEQAAVQVVAAGDGLWPHLGPVPSCRP
jgi:hypothetical protein